jgi:ABC-type dipeptide/oligopeptide/nickel transport system, ATPase component
MDKILEVKDLHVNFATYNGTVQAIRGVNFDLAAGETLAIVGESGSGKSITVRSILQLLAKNADINKGSILYHGEDLLKKSKKEMDTIRGNKISMIFQDPMTSLDPTMTIGKQVAEPLLIHNKVSKKEALGRAEEVLRLVGIPNPKERMNDYPHQFSGGQRQRIVIASLLLTILKFLLLMNLQLLWMLPFKLKLSIY